MYFQEFGEVEALESHLSILLLIRTKLCIKQCKPILHMYSMYGCVYYACYDTIVVILGMMSSTPKRFHHHGFGV